MGMCVRPKARRGRCEHGAVAVEFALIFPVLVMVVFGIIGFGVVLSQQVALGNAVRDGARFGSVGLYSDPTARATQTCGKVIELARDNANALGMSGANVAVTVKRGSSLGTASDRCGAGVGVAAPVGGDRPCEDALPNDNIYVTAQFLSRIEIPLVPMTPELNLDSTGAYRCEYND